MKYFFKTFRRGNFEEGGDAGGGGTFTDPLPILFYSITMHLWQLQSAFYQFLTHFYDFLTTLQSVLQFL